MLNKNFIKIKRTNDSLTWVVPPFEYNRIKMIQEESSFFSCFGFFLSSSALPFLKSLRNQTNIRKCNSSADINILTFICFKDEKKKRTNGKIKNVLSDALPKKKSI